MIEINDDIMTLTEAAKFLKKSNPTMYRLINKKQIPAFKVGGEWRFRRSVLDRWIIDNISSNFQEVLNG